MRLCLNFFQKQTGRGGSILCGDNELNFANTVQRKGKASVRHGWAVVSKLHFWATGEGPSPRKGRLYSE